MNEEDFVLYAICVWFFVGMIFVTVDGLSNKMKVCDLCNTRVRDVTSGRCRIDNCTILGDICISCVHGYTDKLKNILKDIIEQSPWVNNDYVAEVVFNVIPKKC